MEIWRQNSEGLNNQQQMQLWQVLMEFKDLFALNEEEVGLMHLGQHEIDVRDAQPIKIRSRRLPLAQQEAGGDAEGCDYRTV